VASRDRGLRSNWDPQIARDPNSVRVTAPSKDHLDVHRLADGASRRFANDKGFSTCESQRRAEVGGLRLVVRGGSAVNSGNGANAPLPGR
jgi:hypothetical protein